jgi:hypothetical protein
MVQAQQAKSILLEGQQHGDPQHDMMGVYQLVEGKEVNGRGVWQMAGGQEYFMYYASSKEWFISDRADMEAGKDAGWMRAYSTALTPDQVTETWQAYADDASGSEESSDSGSDGTWVAAPNVRARMYSAEVKHAAAVSASAVDALVKAIPDKKERKVVAKAIAEIRAGSTEIE